MPKISVIVPIYNVERYIKRCVVSLFEQTFKDVEYIFVNDASSDRSVDILIETIKGDPLIEKQIQIIHHPVNLGLGSARKTGVTASHGDYIIHCDSDDWVENNCLEMMYDKAIREGADLVWCDYYKDTDNSSTVISTSDRPDHPFSIEDVVDGTCSRGMVIWNKLVRRSIYDGDNFIYAENLSMFEDAPLTLQFFIKAKIVAYVNHPLYHYYIREDSLVSMFFCTNEKLRIDMLNICYLVVRVLKEYNIQNIDEQAMNRRKINVKIFLLCQPVEKRKQWYGLFPELNLSLFAKPYRVRAKIGLWGVSHGMPWLFDMYSRSINRHKKRG